MRRTKKICDYFKMCSVLKICFEYQTDYRIHDIKRMRCVALLKRVVYLGMLSTKALEVHK